MGLLHTVSGKKRGGVLGPALVIVGLLVVTVVVAGGAFVFYVLARPPLCNHVRTDLLGESVVFAARECTDGVNRHAVCDPLPGATPSSRPYTCGCALGSQQVGEVPVDLCALSGRCDSINGAAANLVLMEGGGALHLCAVCSQFDGFEFERGEPR